MLLILLLPFASAAHAQSCEGGLHLNPQVIRGEGASQTESALRELIDFVQSAQSAPMKNHHGTDERIHLAQLVVVPATNAADQAASCSRT
ncbi:MAG: hypothetical protein Q8R59_11460 [Polaromonas sp.]|nr:hypothetical protein [Polaromonas sp.]